MKMFAPAFASLLLLASCERSRVDVMAASTDELATRCFDAVSDSTDPAWIAPHLGDDIAVAKHSDGFDIACPFTLRNGEDVRVKVVVACPADAAVPCTSFRAPDDLSE